MTQPPSGQTGRLSFREAQGDFTHRLRTMAIAPAVPLRRGTRQCRGADPMRDFSGQLPACTGTSSLTGISGGGGPGKEAPGWPGLSTAGGVTPPFHGGDHTDRLRLFLLPQWHPPDPPTLLPDGCPKEGISWGVRPPVLFWRQFPGLP